MNLRDELANMLRLQSCRYSDKPEFKLASGMMSRYYIDCRQTTYSARGMYLVGHVIFPLVRGSGITAIGGQTQGADPIAAAVAYTSVLYGERIDSFSVRKEKKGHGIGGWIVGSVEPGARIAIVEDAITTGDSTLLAIERAREEGLDPVKVVILADRRENGALDRIRRQVPDVSAVFTREELFAIPENYEV